MFLHFLSGQLLAQEVPTMTVGGSKLDVKSMNVNVEVVGNMSAVTYDMVFKNPLSTNTMAKIDFSIKDGQTLAGFATDVKGSLTEAASVEKVQTKKVARGIVRKGDTPFTVTEIVKNKFVVQLEDVPANGTQHVVVKIYEELALNNKKHELTVPLAASFKVDTFASNVSVISSGSLPTGTVSSLGTLEFTKNKEVMTARFQQNDVTPNGTLRLSIPVANNGLTTAFSNGHGYVL